MDDIQQILNYLNRFYKINNTEICDTNDETKLCYVVLSQLVTIFGINEELCKTTLRDWCITNGMTNEDFDGAWSPQVSRFPVPYEPKRNNRFLIEYPSHWDVQMFVTRTCSRPSMFIDIKKFLGLTYSKKIKWNPITITLMDPIGPSTTQRLMDIVHGGLSSITFKINFKIQMLDPTGVVVEEWMLTDCEIKSINFGELSMMDDNIAICTLVVQTNNIILHH